MSVNHLLVPADEARQPGTGLCDVLMQWSGADWTATSGCHLSERRAIEANRATIELAKGALVRRFGVDRIQAFSLMVRWARLTHTPVHTLARTLVRGLGEADPQTERRHRPLIRWLEGASSASPIPESGGSTPPGRRPGRSAQAPYPLMGAETGVGVRGHHLRS